MKRTIFILEQKTRTTVFFANLQTNSSNNFLEISRSVINSRTYKCFICLIFTIGCVCLNLSQECEYTCFRTINICLILCKRNNKKKIQTIETSRKIGKNGKRHASMTIRTQLIFAK